MKKLVYVFLILSFSGFSQNNSVDEIYVETDSNILDFQMVNTNVGYLILETKIKRTIDGGNTWHTVFTANISSSHYRDFLFTDSNTGFLLAKDEILKTTDGGITWISKFFDAPTSNNAAYFDHRKISMNGNIGFVGVNSCATNEPFNSSCPKWYLKTTDGGETWSKVFTPSNLYSFEKINCDDPSELYGFNVARQSFGVNGSLFNGVLKSTDNGISWQSVTPLLNVFHSDIARFNSKKYYSATVGLNQDATAYYISKSIEMPTLTNLDLSEYVFVDNEIHFALGKSAVVSGFASHIYRTNDGGQTWFFIDDHEITGYVKQDYRFLQRSGNILWFVSSSNKLYKLTYEKTPAKTMQVVPIVGVDNPNGIAVNDQKELFFTEYDNNSVRRYNPATQQTTTVAGGNGRGSSPNKLYDPSGILVKDNDMFIVNYFGNTIKKWAIGNPTGVDVAGGVRDNGDGTYTRLLYRPNDVAIDNLGDLYIVSTLDNKVVKWTPGAADGVTLFGGNGVGSGNDQFNGAVGIARTSDGTIYIADTYNHRIQKFLPGQTSGITVAGNGLEGNNTRRLSKPVSIQVTTDGTIYVLEYGNNRITKWTEGNLKGEIVLGDYSTGNATNKMNKPRDFVFDESTTTFYIADTDNKRILSYTIPCEAENLNGQVVQVYKKQAAILTADACSSGIIKWYNQSTNGNLVFTGIPFTTPILENSSVYYATCVKGSCESNSRAVINVNVSNCEFAIDLTTTTSINGNFKAFQDIKANKITVGIVNLQSERQINLLPGFVSQSGNVLKAEITPCN